MFGSSLNSENDKSGGSDNASSFNFIFLTNRMIMDISDPKPKDVMEVESAYTTDNHICSLRRQLTFSSFVDEEEVILEACSLEEREHVAVSDASTTSYFYFYLPIIRKLKVILPFSSFIAEVVAMLNMAPC